MDALKFLDYGVLGLLTLVLLGVGWGLKLVFSRWLCQIDAAIRAQECGSTAMIDMSRAMSALTSTITEHSLATAQEHRIMVEALTSLRKVAAAKSAPKARAADG